ncbi:DUF3108 domain-containing protein [Neptunicoccus cionae]|uniref:DUF3108 domain-containing protein n=1 Tax=Neptunicoccus cionae TaxID=2035344 RepID=UPI000C76EFD2|nr:DUF3108 domain-containing protein [Amylibacter cionae]PLS23459.1 hypothetical protein C0U40_04910 [Amylibacter cionae]
MRLIFSTLALLGTGLAASADEIDQTYGFYVAGLKAGTIHITGTVPAIGSEGSYLLKGTLSPTSIMRRFHDVRFDGQVDGIVTPDGRLHPARYEGFSRSDTKESDVQLVYDAGRPQVVRYAPERSPQPFDIIPAKQNGAIDPLSAAYLLFQDQPLDTLCDRSFSLFDGRRLSRLEVGAPDVNAAEALCEGRYTRVAGFSPEDIEEQVTFPFTLVYTRGDADLYSLSFFKTDTTFGPAEAARK